MLTGWLTQARWSVLGPCRNGRVWASAVTSCAPPALDAAVAGAAKRSLGDSWAWARRGLSVDISPLVAVSLARWGHATRAHLHNASRASTSERATTPGVSSCPGVVARTGPGAKSSRSPGPVGISGVRFRGRTRTTDYCETPATRPALRTRHRPCVAKAQHEKERPRVEGHRDGRVPPGDGTTLWPSWSPLVRSAGSAAAQLANMVQLG